jgi:hypothetical protein
VLSRRLKAPPQLVERIKSKNPLTILETPAKKQTVTGSVTNSTTIYEKKFQPVCGER